MPDFQMKRIYLGKEPSEVRHMHPQWIVYIEQMVSKQVALSGPVEEPRQSYIVKADYTRKGKLLQY